MNDQRTRKSLIEGLKNPDDTVRWEQFYQAYAPLIRGLCAKAGLNQPEADDVVQETIISVSKNMATFNYNPAEGSFKAWLFKLVLWRIKDQVRKRLPDSPGNPESFRNRREERTSTIDRVPDPAGSQLEEDWDQQWKMNSLERAMEKVKTKVNARQFQIFQLTAVQGLASAKVANSLGVSIGHVYLATHRVGRLVRKEVKEMEKRGLT